MAAAGAQRCVSILPHAEEVKLRDGAAPANIDSTTGRRFRIAGSSDGDVNAGGEESTWANPPTPLASPTAATVGKASRGGFPKITSSSAATETRVRGHVAVSRRSTYKCYDLFGFRVTEEEKAAEDYARRQVRDDLNNLAKWDNLIERWRTLSPAKSKAFCRRGVPQCRRRIVWQYLLRSWRAKERHPGVYMRLCNQPLPSKDLEDIIERDLARTFPTHRLFGDGSSGVGVRMLRRILHAYANYNATIGYCQGMGFLAATLLLIVEEEEAIFWAFVALMEDKKYSMKSIFAPGFPQLHRTLYVFESLMRKIMPQLSIHLHDTYQIQPSFYAVHWFMTAFTYYFNFGLAARIWDMFLCEGWKPVYRVALALLKMEEPQLLKLKSETELLLALKVIQESKRPQEILKTALQIKFKTAYVEKVIERYYRTVQPA